MELTSENIDKVIQEKIAETLSFHNGSCSLSRIEIETRTVYLNIHGGCAGCPSSSITLYNFIEPVLSSHFENITVLLEQ